MTITSMVIQEPGMEQLSLLNVFMVECNALPYFITLNHCLTKTSVGIAAVNYFSKSESIDVNIPVFLLTHTCMSSGLMKDHIMSL